MTKVFYVQNEIKALQFAMEQAMKSGDMETCAAISAEVDKIEKQCMAATKRSINELGE